MSSSSSWRVINAVRAILPLVKQFKEDPTIELEVRLGVSEKNSTFTNDRTWKNNVTREEFLFVNQLLNEYGTSDASDEKSSSETKWTVKPATHNAWQERADHFWYRALNDASSTHTRQDDEERPYIRSSKIGAFGDTKFFQIEKVDHVDIEVISSLAGGKKHDIRIAIKREIPIEAQPDQLGVPNETRLKNFQIYSHESAFPIQFCQAITARGANRVEAVKLSKEPGNKNYEVEIEMMRNAQVNAMSCTDIGALLIENMIRLFIDVEQDTGYQLFPIIRMNQRKKYDKKRKLTQLV